MIHTIMYRLAELKYKVCFKAVFFGATVPPPFLHTSAIGFEPLDYKGFHIPKLDPYTV